MTGQNHIFFILKEKTLEDERMNMLNYTTLIYIVFPYIHTRGTFFQSISGWGLCLPGLASLVGHSAIHILPLECGGWHRGILMAQ